MSVLAPPGTQPEIPLADGYPDKRYIFDGPNADDIVDKLYDAKDPTGPVTLRYRSRLPTLRETMRRYAGSEEVDETELEGLASLGAELFDMIAEVRPELHAGARTDDTLAAAGVLWSAYGDADA